MDFLLLSSVIGIASLHRYVLVRNQARSLACKRDLEKEETLSGYTL